MPRANRQRRRRSRLSAARCSARIAALHLEIAARVEQAEADELGMEPHELRYLRERGIDPRAPVPRLFGDRIDAIAAARAGAHPPLALRGALQPEPPEA
jgi:Ser/Thr protein kinase RdoA (MazF antagonist)